jgi:two-component sensor histidine kinase
VRTELQLREQTGELELAHRRKDEFLGVLGHELRNPLSPLSNTLHVLASREAELPDAVRQAHDTMRRQVQHISRLVDDLLDVSRINEGKIALRRERVDVAEAVAQAVANLRPTFEKRGIALRNLRPTSAAWVDADPVRLDQVITNLLNNAAKYTPAGGRVDVTTTLEAARVVVRVHDTGVGIPIDMLSRVFEPFVQAETGRTRAFGGLGIGLTLVQRLVELQGGSVHAESPGPGAGSTFVVTLPLVESSRPRVALVQRPPRRRFRPGAFSSSTTARPPRPRWRSCCRSGAIRSRWRSMAMRRSARSPSTRPTWCSSTSPSPAWMATRCASVCAICRMDTHPDRRAHGVRPGRRPASRNGSRLRRARHQTRDACDAGRAVVPRVGQEKSRVGRAPTLVSPPRVDVTRADQQLARRNV